MTAQVNHIHSGGDEELVHDHIERITRLEGTVAKHSEALATLVPSVAAIENHLKAIKWLCGGALAFFLIQKFGTVEGLEKLAKLL